MTSNKQRRDTDRRNLERRLQERQEREASRRRATLIGSVVGTVAVIALVVIIIVVASSGGSSKKPTASGSGASSVTYQGITVGAATDLKHEPKVTSTSTTDPTALGYKDLVVGTGAAATPTSSVSVQYTGVLYRNGTQFDSSWAGGGKPVQFSLARVVPGFTQGIGGTTTVPPMRVGGRRIVLMPAALGYGAQAQSSIPANSSLVFVIDLTKIG